MEELLTRKLKHLKVTINESVVNDLIFFKLKPVWIYFTELEWDQLKINNLKTLLPRGVIL
jgi:hypothetical protein